MIEPISVRKTNQVFQVNRKVSARCIFIVCLTVMIISILSIIIFIAVYYTVYINKSNTISNNDNNNYNQNKRNHSNSLIFDEILLNESFYENNCKFFSYLFI